METSRWEKHGRNFMIAGFALILVAAARFLLHRNGTPLDPDAFRNAKYLMVAGIAVYFVGRSLYWRGRRERKKKEAAGQPPDPL